MKILYFQFLKCALRLWTVVSDFLHCAHGFKKEGGKTWKQIGFPVCFIYWFILPLTPGWPFLKKTSHSVFIKSTFCIGNTSQMKFSFRYIHYKALTCFTWEVRSANGPQAKSTLNSCPPASVNTPQIARKKNVIRCRQAGGPSNPVCYCSLALFPSVLPSVCISDGCSRDVSWPGGSFHVWCAGRERGTLGERSWSGEWQKFCPTSTPILYESL